MRTNSSVWHQTKIMWEGVLIDPQIHYITQNQIRPARMTKDLVTVHNDGLPENFAELFQHRSDCLQWTEESHS